MPPQPHIRAAVYPSSVRMLAAALVALSRGSLPLILVRMLVSTDPPITPSIVVRLFVLFTVIPAGAAWLIQRSAHADVEVEGAGLSVRRRRWTMEVPYSAMAGIEPWAVPLPGAGFSVRLRSGQRLRHVFQLADAKPLLYAIADRGHVESARPAVRHLTVVWANAKASVASSVWDRALVKFVFFALLPAIGLFYTSQRVSYGSVFGEYRAEGLGAWLETFVYYWVSTSVYLVLYASLLRAVAESLALAAASVAPLSAVGLRRAIEILYRLAFYGGVPAMMLLSYRA